MAAFYQELVRGKLAGEAMLTGQQALGRDTSRNEVYRSGQAALLDVSDP